MNEPLQFANPSFDFDGLKIAAIELLEEGFAEKRIERFRARAQGVENMDDIVRSVMPRRSLAEGFYRRASYLGWLVRAIDAGERFSLFADELIGIVAVRAAELEYERNHPSCNQCGEPLPARDAAGCEACGARQRKGA